MNYPPKHHAHRNPRRLQHSTLAHVRAWKHEHHEAADVGHEEGGVGGVMNDRVRAGRDELVPFAHHELEGEGPPQGVVAPLSPHGS